MRHLQILIAVPLVVGCAGGSSQSALAVSVASGRPVYDGSVVIDPSSRRIQAHWKIDFVRDAAMQDSATMLLNPALTISSLSGPDISGYSERSEGDAKRIIVRFKQPTSGRVSPSRIDIAYAGAPTFGSDSINGISTRWAELGLDSFWHPVFSDFRQRITGRTQIVLPSGWKLAASGTVGQSGDTLTLTNDVPLIDIAFSASPDLAFSERGNARVYYAGAPPAAVPMILDIATACTSWLDAHYGAAGKLPPTRFVLAPRRGPGYARKNYIVITGEADTSRLGNERFVCHELAHYWSSGAISSGPENWLNEAFAEYVAGRYIRDAHGDSTYAAVVLKRWRDNSANAGPIWTPTATRRPTARAAYNKAPAVLDQLESRIGRATMDKILTRYMTEGVHTTAALLDVVANIAGAETSTWFRDQLAAPGTTGGSLAPAPAARPFRPGIRFDPATLRPGTRVGSLVADSVTARRTVVDSTYVGIARFRGQIELTGKTLRHPDADLAKATNCFEADSASASLLPRWTGDERRPWFCFVNQADARRALGPPSEGVPATIVVDAFTIYRGLSDEVNSARFLRRVR